VYRLLLICSLSVASLTALTVVPASLRAQSDDDLLSGLGDDDADKGDDADKEGEGGVPIEDQTLDDIDIDAPLDDGDAAAKKPEEPPAEQPKEAAPAKAEAAAPAAAAEPAKAAEAEAEAEEPEAAKPDDPARLDRVKAVPRKPTLKAFRGEFTPQFGVSVNDAFFTHLSVGGGGIFYPHDNFGIGLSGAYYVAHVKSGKEQTIRAGETAVFAVFELPTASASLDIYFVPIYGKIALFNKFIIPFDLYAVAGVGFVAAGAAMRPSFKAGIGQRFMINEWLAVRLEVTDTIFNDVQEVNGQPRSDIQNYMMFQAGVSVFVPPSFDYAGL